MVEGTLDPDKKSRENLTPTIPVLCKRVSKSVNAKTKRQKMQRQSACTILSYERTLGVHCCLDITATRITISDAGTSPNRLITHSGNTPTACNTRIHDHHHQHKDSDDENTRTTHLMPDYHAGPPMCSSLPLACSLLRLLCSVSHRARLASSSENTGATRRGMSANRAEYSRRI